MKPIVRAVPFLVSAFAIAFAISACQDKPTPARTRVAERDPGQVQAVPTVSTIPAQVILPCAMASSCTPSS